MEQMKQEADKFFTQETIARKDTEKSLIKMIDDKTQALRDLINKESKIRYQNIEDLEDTL